MHDITKLRQFIDEREYGTDDGVTIWKIAVDDARAELEALLVERNRLEEIAREAIRWATSSAQRDLTRLLEAAIR